MHKRGNEEIVKSNDRQQKMALRNFVSSVVIVWSYLLKLPTLQWTPKQSVLSFPHTVNYLGVGSVMQSLYFFAIFSWLCFQLTWKFWMWLFWFMSAERTRKDDEEEKMYMDSYQDRSRVSVSSIFVCLPCSESLNLFMRREYFYRGRDIPYRPSLFRS